MNDTYLEPARPAEAELGDRGSRFIARVSVVATADEAEARIAEVRKTEYDATHHCSAYRIGPAGDVFRSNDDGEPSGSAGAPILRQIEGRELTNTVVVVTRYYGGTKLGVGGLIRAYGGAASAALDAAGVREVVSRTPCRVSFDYDDTSRAVHCVERFDAVVRERNYSEVTELVLGVRNGQLDAFEAAFTDALGGRGRFERIVAP
jgi:uncharacterized YigZ family protein